MAVTPPVVPSTDERFLRLTRNEQVRKRRRARTYLRAATWVALHLAVASVIGLAAWGGHHYLTHSEHFQVARILVAGDGYAPEADISKVTGLYRGKNIFVADLEALQAKLEGQPWIKSAHAKRRIPDTLLIQIEERVPEVLVKVRDGIYLADGEGVLLDRFGPAYADYDFPILTGLDRAGRTTMKRRIQQGAAFVNFLYQTRPQLADQVSEVGMEEEGELEVRLNDGGPPLRVSPDSFGLNLDNYLAMRNYIASNYGAVKYVDLRWKDRISILPEEGRSSEHGTNR